MRFRFFAILLLLGVVAAAQPGRVYTSLQQVEDPDEVYILQLRHQRLKTLPAEVLEMHNLEELDLRGNHIALLPDNLCQLRHLRRLELSRNPLTALPATLAQLDSLQELVLWSTYITDLPATFARLDGTLLLLDLRHCPLTLDDQSAIEALLPTPQKLWDYACNCGD